MKALVIVHLSSLDAYSEQAGLEKASALAEYLRYAILSWEGRVYIIDQRWPFSDLSEPRRNLVFDVQLKRDIRWTHFDEWRDDWEELMREFGSMLIRDGVREVVLGGVWYEPADGAQAGAVADMLRILKKKHIRVRVYPHLTARLSVAS